MKRFILYAATLLTLGGCSAPAPSEPATAPAEPAATAATETTDTAMSATTSPTTGAAKGAAMDYSNKIVELQTTKGTITLRLYPDVAPNHVANFVELAQSGFYNGTKFHRIIPGFMIQGGDPNTKTDNRGSWGTGGSGKNIKAEFNAKNHRRGILSMARSNDPDSASSQFFITVDDASFLDRNYTVFGEVVSGMDVADAIVSAPRGANDQPNDPVSITKAVVRDAQPGEIK